MEDLEALGLLVPDYEGNTIANIPATIAALFRAPGPGLAPLRPALWDPLLNGEEVRRVVLILIDGMGQNLLQLGGQEVSWLEEEALVAGQITSVFPSTTVNALSCLWTGAGPAQHGLVGLEMFFPKLGVIGQMLALTPSFIWSPDALVKAGVDPYTFLPVAGFAQTLAEVGVETVSLKDYRLVNSTLSKMHSRGVKTSRGIVTAADLMWQLRSLLEQRSAGRQFIAAYWPAVDTLSHRYGFDHPAVVAELAAFLHLLRATLFEQLSAEARRGTIVIVTADHGQINTPLEKRIFVEDHPELLKLLLMRAAGEPHSAYLYARQGQTQRILEYVREHLSYAATALDAQEALHAGLFGPPPFAGEVDSRIGDVIVTMRDGYSLLSREVDEFLAALVGRHGGLTPAEMEVPFCAFCLS